MLNRTLLRDGVVHARKFGPGRLDRLDNIGNNRLGAVVDRRMRAERLDKVKVGRRARRDDRDARAGRELDRGAPDRGGPAVDEDDLALARRVRGLGAREREVQVVGLVETGRGGRERERQDGGLVERDIVRDRRREEGVDDRELLEARVLRLARHKRLAVSARGTGQGERCVGIEGRIKEGTHPRTRSPFLTLVTPSPTSRTSPATSVPRMNG